MKLENFERLIAGRPMIFPSTEKKIVKAGTSAFTSMFLEWLYLEGFEIIYSKDENNFLDNRRKRR